MSYHDETPSRSAKPIIKVIGLASLHFERVELDPIQRFAVDFGFALEDRTASQLILRSAAAGPACVIVRKASSSRFAGLTFMADNAGDLGVLASAWERPLVPYMGGQAVETEDPSGLAVRVAHGATELPELPVAEPQRVNRPGSAERPNQSLALEQRPAAVLNLGHVALQTPRLSATLEWYMENLGLIVSEFRSLDSSAEQVGPVSMFLRLDLGDELVDHHVLVLSLGPEVAYEHSGFAVTDLDALAIGSRYLDRQGHHHVWGIGRQDAGSHLFDHWAEPDGALFEHFADGDRFDASMAPHWSTVRADNIAWGPEAPREFAGGRMNPRRLRNIVGGLLDRSSDVTPRYVREVTRRSKET